MDRELSEDYVKKTKWQKIIITASAVIAVIFVFWVFRSLITPSLNGSYIRTSIAEIGDVESTVNASGIVIPEYEQNLISPVKSKILVVNFQPGQYVQAGQQIIEIDRESVQNDYNSIVDQNELKNIEIKKKRLTVTQSLHDLNANLDIQKLRVKSLESGLEREKKLFEIGASTTIKVDQTELDLQIAKRELLLLEEQIENRKQTLNTEIEELELELKILSRSQSELKNKLDDSYLRAGNNGVITWIKKDIGANVDAGEIIVKVADLNSYKVEASVSDIHADKLIPGGKVKVRVSGNDLTGYINGISPSSNSGVTNFTIVLDEKNSKVLKPNLRVEVFVILNTSENVVRVKNGPFFTASADQAVFVIKENKGVRVQTTFGASNFDYVEIKSGVEPGDKVIISNMDEYKHMKEIDIN